MADLDVISPELVLVDPDLAALARASLGDYEYVPSAALATALGEAAVRTVAPCPATQRRAGETPKQALRARAWRPRAFRNVLLALSIGCNLLLVLAILSGATTAAVPGLAPTGAKSDLRAMPSVLTGARPPSSTASGREAGQLAPVSPPTPATSNVKKTEADRTKPAAPPRLTPTHTGSAL